MQNVRITALMLLLAALAQPALGQKKLSTSEAKDHVGEVATVCGEVASTPYAPSTKGQPTFINLDKPYPNSIFTVLIWGSARSKFGTPENEYKGKRVCVTGKITAYRGAPEIVANDPGRSRLIRDRGSSTLRCIPGACPRRVPRLCDSCVSAASMPRS